jgi:oxygen-independent coproporphyrinogen-3 oxidase
MAGIYIHIPFCRQKCHYCNFFSTASRRHRDEFTGLLLDEMALQRNYLSGETVTSVYFGGGTPSLLDPGAIQTIMDGLGRYHSFDIAAEITLEANPDDLTVSYLRALRRIPVNRLSIGIQSFHDDDLIYLNRAHDAAQALASIRHALDAGFTRLTLDLIYGIPTLTTKKWMINLRQAVSFQIPHLSAYALTIEPGTALQRLIEKGKAKPVKEDDIISHYRLLCRTMKAENYQHYEISNFCKSGWHARHNTGYWTGMAYLGLGPSAHSCDGLSRQWNVSLLEPYIRAVKDGKVPAEKEILTDIKKYNEYVMTSLRTMWGCDVSFIKTAFSREFYDLFQRETLPYIHSGQMVAAGNHVHLTDESMLFADRIASDLFMTGNGSR